METKSKSLSTNILSIKKYEHVVYPPDSAPIVNKLFRFVIENEHPELKGGLPSDTWFIAKEIEFILQYKDIKSVDRLGSDHKIILKKQDILKNVNMTLLENTTIEEVLNLITSNRGITLIDSSSVNSIISKSYKKEVEPYKQWLSQTVIPSLYTTGEYRDVNTSRDIIDGMFNNLLYSNSIDTSTGEDNVLCKESLKVQDYEYARVNGFFSIGKDPIVRGRILNMAFLECFSLSVYNVDPAMNILQDPFSIAYRIGGPNAVQLLHSKIVSIMMELRFGVPLEELEKVSWFRYNNKIRSNYWVPYGKAFQEYLKSQNDIEKEEMERLCNDGTHIYGLDPDRLVNKEK